MLSRASRREVLKAAYATALLPALSAGQQRSNGWTPGTGMPQEGPDTPKICAPVNGRELTEKGMREVKQIGVNWVLTGGPAIPWEESQLHALVDKLKTGGLALGNMMISGFPNTLYGRPGRDDEIEKSKHQSELPAKSGCRLSSTTSTRIAPLRATTKRQDAAAPALLPSKRVGLAGCLRFRKKAFTRWMRCGAISRTS